MEGIITQAPAPPSNKGEQTKISRLGWALKEKWKIGAKNDGRRKKQNGRSGEVRCGVQALYSGDLEGQGHDAGDVAETKRNT